jgi:hypothetical protein
LRDLFKRSEKCFDPEVRQEAPQLRQKKNITTERRLFLISSKRCFKYWASAILDSESGNK